MKKLLSICIVSILLTGCNKGVSQKEYKDLQVTDNESIVALSKLEEQYLNLESEYNGLVDDYKELGNKYNELLSLNEDTINTLSDMTTKYMDLLATTGEDVVVEAWGNVAFGDNVKYSIIDSYTIQYIHSIESVIENSILLSFKSVTDNISTLQAATSSKNIDYVYIKIIDYNFCPVYELFIDFSGVEVKTDILTNVIYNDLITEALEQL